MKAMIHKELERMNGIFQKYGIETEGFPDPAPSSLTALLLRDREIAFFLLPNVEAWSLGRCRNGMGLGKSLSRWTFRRGRSCCWALWVPRDALAARLRRRHCSTIAKAWASPRRSVCPRRLWLRSATFARGRRYRAGIALGRSPSLPARPCPMTAMCWTWGRDRRRRH